MTESDNRTIVVTGGTGALGKELVCTLLDRGWRVRVPWHTERGVEGLLARVGDRRDRLELDQADASDPDAMAAFLDGVPVYGLCNIAGGFSAGAIAETEPTAWERLLKMNATTAWISTRAAVSRMREQGVGGRVVNVAAFPALERGRAGMAAYAASKAAVVSLTYSLATELRPDGITVNAIAPEIMDTEGNRREMPDADRSTWLGTTEVSRVVAFLLSDEAAIVTGSVLTLAKG